MGIFFNTIHRVLYANRWLKPAEKTNCTVARLLATFLLNRMTSHLSLPHRPRRLRHTPALRRMVRETILTPADFIYPIFVVHGEGVSNPIPSMPGISQLSVDMAVGEAKRAAELGVPAVLALRYSGGERSDRPRKLCAGRHRAAGDPRD